MQSTGDRDARPGICTGWSYINYFKLILTGDAAIRYEERLA